MMVPQGAASEQLPAQPAVMNRQTTSGSVALAELRSCHSPLSVSDKPNTLTWQDLTFSIGEKDILKDVTGRLEPGRLIGIMGPSGSGKTTLLNVLSGRQRTSGKDSSQGKAQRVKMAGQVTLSGESVQPADYRQSVAYVYQDSALPPCETPRECIDFSAFLRLPATVSDKERKNYVNRMLESLNLESCADTVVGSALQKGISGGQQKRTAVGVELISNPKLLFLDEPLSGLDSYNAAELVSSLKDLALSGVPVLMTLHQPSSDLFAKLDDLIVLHQGEVCFHGPAKQLAGHFRGLGFDVPPNHNPADDVLFLIQTESQEVVRSIKDRWLQSEPYRVMQSRIEHLSTTADADERGHRTSSSESSEDDDHACIGKPAPEPRKAGCSPLRMLVTRDFRAMKRQLPLFVQQMIIFKLIVALLYGLFFFQQGKAADDPSITPNCLPDSFDAGACNRDFINHFSALSLVAMTVVIDSMNMPVILYHSERSTFLREAAGGYYNVTSYFLSKSFVEACLVLSECLAIALGTYWLVGFHAGFVHLVLGMWLLALTSSSMMWWVHTAARTREQAVALATAPWIMQFMFSGLLLPIKQIPAFIRWLRWVCPLYYGLGFIATAEFGFLYADADAPAAPAAPASLNGTLPQLRDVPEGVALRRDILISNGIYERDHWWPYFGMCCVLFVAYRILAVFTMWRNSRFVV